MLLVFIFGFAVQGYASNNEGMNIPFIKYETSTVITNQPGIAASTQAYDMKGLSFVGGYSSTNLVAGDQRQGSNLSIIGNIGKITYEYIVKAVVGNEIIKPSLVEGIVSKAKSAYCTKDVSQVSLTIGADANGSIGIANAGMQAGVGITIDCKQK